MFYVWAFRNALLTETEEKKKDRMRIDLDQKEVKKTMEAYTGFAEVYDELMDNIPYPEWSEYLTSLLKEYGVEKGLVAELGCGTGNITELLSAKGYDMIGIDNSEEMLSIAREKQMMRQMEELSDETMAEAKSEAESTSILYLLQDMREFELYGTVDAVVSICDSMNYILEEEDLKKVFSLVNNYLEERGIFIFDLNTVYKYRELLGQNTIAENREDCSFIWENDFDEKTGINEYGLTLYVQEDEELFRRYEEVHYQKAYTLETIQRLLAETGMEFVAAYDAFTKEPPKENSERIYIVAREGHQAGKYYESRQKKEV